MICQIWYCGLNFTVLECTEVQFDEAVMYLSDFRRPKFFLVYGLVKSYNIFVRIGMKLE